MMSADQLWECFDGLAKPDEDGGGLTFSVGPEDHSYRIGRNRRDLPCLLVRCSETEGLVTPRLRHLRIRAGADCELVTSDGSGLRESLTIIEPVDVPRDLSRFLVGSFHSVMMGAGTTPGLGDLQRLVSEIAEVFRGLGSLAGATAQGLWAELFVITSSEDAERAAWAWHRDFEERWDFVDGDQRLEVKSNASASDRRHHFTLEQVCPPDGVSAYVASITLSRGAGLSLDGLVDRVRARLAGDPDVLSRLEQTIAAALGEEAHEVLKVSFDEDVARASLRLYRASAVPKPDCDHDPGVVRVEFVSDLDFAAWLAPEAVAAARGLVAGLSAAAGVGG